MGREDVEAAPVCASPFVSFFFFQAKDGIGDYKVTGVQACALPILVEHVCQGLLAQCLSVLGSPLLPLNPATAHPGLEAGLRHCFYSLSHLLGSPTTVLQRTRSEERRVGKEGRSRWSPYH